MNQEILNEKIKIEALNKQILLNRIINTDVLNKQINIKDELEQDLLNRKSYIEELALKLKSSESENKMGQYIQQENINLKNVLNNYNVEKLNIQIQLEQVNEANQELNQINIRNNELIKKRDIEKNNLISNITQLENFCKHLESNKQNLKQLLIDNNIKIIDLNKELTTSNNNYNVLYSIHQQLIYYKSDLEK
jgi:hypothetical protein